MSAVHSAHRNYFDPAIRASFADSLELDEALRVGHEADNRWDYLLGHEPSKELVAVEPHPANDVSAVIKKREAAREQLKGHLHDGTKIARWLWVASGKVYFAPTEKDKLRLDQNGIEFVGKTVKAKHLPTTAAPRGTASRAKSRRKK